VVLYSVDNVIDILTRLWVSQFGVRILIEPRNFSVHQNAHTGSAAHPTSYSVVNGLLCRA